MTGPPRLTDPSACCADDHFTIPGGGPGGGLDEAEQAEMLTVSPGIKERFQRFQLVYHIRLMHEYEDILLGGFHIEEQVYGPKYYYPALDGWIKSACCPPVAPLPEPPARRDFA